MFGAEPNGEIKTGCKSEYKKAESQSAGGRVYPLTVGGLISDSGGPHKGSLKIVSFVLLFFLSLRSGYYQF